MRTREQKLEAIEWAIHSANANLAKIRADSELDDGIRSRQIEAHESYLRSLFALRQPLLPESPEPATPDQAEIDAENEHLDARYWDRD